MAPTLSGPELSVQTCRRRLDALLGPSYEGPSFECDISWYGPARVPAGRRASEATSQALAGVMEVNGWDAGHPRRLGLEVASVAAGLLAANGVMATLIGAQRGRRAGRVETSVIQAALWLIAHHIAAATCDDQPLASPSGPEPGPPFRTADSRWFEIEVFDAEAWKLFWQQLGAGGADLGRAWTSFRARYYRGRCSFPPGLHDATARHSLAAAAEAAKASGVSLSAVRTYAEVLQHPGWDVRHVSVAARPADTLLADTLLADSGPAGSGPAGSGPAGSGPADTPSGGRRRSGVASDEGLPLQGIRVVEATSRMQGPLAGLLLQMLGAEVVRVEPPGGDVGRMVPPVCGDVGTFFQCFNRGKESVEIDLTVPSGRSELLDLLAASDVFLHNWRPGRAAAWGLDRQSLSAANPQLVYAQASGWGGSSENAHLIGTDFLVQAYAGFGDGLNPVGAPPLTSRVLLTDNLGALVTCEGVLAGLYINGSKGGGADVGTSLLEGAMAAQAHVLDSLASGRDIGRRDGRPVWGPLDHPIAVNDGWVVATTEGHSDYRRLCQVCGVDGDRRSRPQTDQALADSLAAGSAQHWETLLTEADIACQTVTRDLATLPEDPRLAPLFEPLLEGCRAPASPWILTP